jgi:alpha-galactosidase
MPKITFMGAGSSAFVKNVLGDAMLNPSLHEAELALYDIDPVRLEESKLMIDTLNANINQGRARIKTFLGTGNRRAALNGANYVVNAIQVGGYKPSTVIDFEIPKKYGLRQTIADTLGIGGIFRALRTIPVLLDFAHDMEKVCPEAWFINYSNPMAMNTGALVRGTSIRTVGLCHSVQGCTQWLFKFLDMPEPKKLQWKIAGINHQSWLLEITDGGRDLYPKIKRIAARKLQEVFRQGGAKAVIERAKKKHGSEWSNWFEKEPAARIAHDMVRMSLMLRLGYYITESSEHSSEYMPYWIKRTHPELIDQYNIPLDEYPRRCIGNIKQWKKQKRELVLNKKLTHEKSVEYGAGIMEATESGNPFRFGGNVLNTGLIPNLPAKAVVEVPCVADRSGVQACYVGDLPEQCAALNRTNINVQILTIDAALSRKRDLIYQAAMMDPHTAAELTLDETVSLCDDMIRAHGRMLPRFK